MEPYPKIKEFCARFKDLPENVFTVRFPDPFLVISMVIRSGETSVLYKNHEKKSKDETLKGSVDEEAGRILIIVVPLKKKGVGPGGPITVGRGQDNDIVIPHPSVSRCHAVFKEDLAAGVYSVTDLGSSYGTAIESGMLEPNQPSPVKDGA
ncbi:MAG: FHA domain-containing protein, partial [Planctomycetota bacterium]